MTAGPGDAPIVVLRRSTDGPVRPDLADHVRCGPAGLAGCEKSGSAELGVAGPDRPARRPGRQAAGAGRPGQVRVGPARKRRLFRGGAEPDRWGCRGMPGCRPLNCRRAVGRRCDVLDRWPLPGSGREVEAAAGFIRLGRFPAVWVGGWRVRAVGNARHDARGAIGCRFRAGAGIRQRLRGGQAVDARLVQAARTPAPESAPAAAVDGGDGDRRLRSRWGVHGVRVLSKRLPVV